MAIAVNDGSGYFLDVLELEAVLSKISETIGAPLDLLAMDANQQATLELAYQMRQSVQCLVASEDNIPASGFPYRAVLGSLRDAPGMSPRDLAVLAVKRFAEHHSSAEAQAGFYGPTLVALDLSQIEELVRAVDDLAGEILSDISRLRISVWRAHGKARKFAYIQSCDLKDLVEALAAETGSQGVVTAASAIQEALQPGGPIVLDAYSAENAQDMGGVAIYLISPPRPGISRSYADLALPQDTKWDELLRAYHEEPTLRPWFVTANPEQYDWDRAFEAGSEEWTQVRGTEAQQNLRQARPGDVVLAYRSTPDKYITGLGHIAGEPYEYEDRHAVRIEMDLKLKTGVSLDELKQATPDLQHVTRRRPSSFSPVTAEQWAVIREMILYHNLDLAPEALPSARAIEEEFQARALGAVAPRLTGEALEHALTAALDIKNDEFRVRALADLAPHLPAEARVQALEAALEAALAIEDENSRVRALADLAPHLTGEARAQALEAALEAALAIEDETQRSQVLVALAPNLTAESRNRAWSLAKAIRDFGSREKVLAALSPNFAGLIAEKMKDFTGREWALARIDRWLADPAGPGHFVIAGEPGSGKTALAARLTQVPAVAAHNFCIAGRPETVDPRAFVRTIILQLINTLPGFGPALLQGDGSTIQISQKASQMAAGARVVGLHVGTLDLGAPSPDVGSSESAGIDVNQSFARVESGGRVVGASVDFVGLGAQVEISQSIASLEPGATLQSMQVDQVLLPDAPTYEIFSRFVIEPLARQADSSTPVVILVDGLDIAPMGSDGESILDLVASTADLPPQTRFVVTTRPDRNVTAEFEPKFIELSLDPRRAENKADVRAFIKRRVDTSEALQKRLADEGWESSAFVSGIMQSSEGNFGRVHDLLATAEREEALSRIEFTFGDLLDQRVDAIVHPTSPKLMFDGMIGRQIREKLGASLDDLLPSPRTVEFGEALTTEAPSLPPRYLIHAPMRKVDHYNVQTVVRGASAALAAADNLGDVQTVAFPSMGTGAARLKPEDVAPKILTTIVEHLEQESHLQEVRFVFDDESAYEAYIAAYQALGGKIKPPDWLSGLSPSSRQAVGIAGALSQHLGHNEVTDGHLLWGLYQKPGGPARELLTTAGSHERMTLMLEDLVQAPTRTPDLLPVSEAELDQLPLCATCQQALEEASKAAVQKGAKQIRSRHLLAGLLAVPQSEAAGWLAQTLSRDAEVLGKLLRRLPEDESLTSSWLQAALLRMDEVTYDVQLDLDLPDETLQVGQAFTVCVSLLAADAGAGECYTLSLARQQAEGAELSIFLDRQAVHALGSFSDNVPLDLGSDSSLSGDSVLAHATDAGVLDQAQFSASALRPGETRVRVDLHLGAQYLASLEKTVQVEPTVERLPQLARRPRPVPHPDLILQVRTAWGQDGTITFHHRLDSSRGQPLGVEGLDHQSPALPADWAERVRTWLAETLEGAAGELAADLNSRLAALGQALYRATLPPEVGKALQERAGRGQTLLLVADRSAWLPWELLHDGWGFLGERFVLGRWPLEQEKSRPYEFPLGQVSVLEYEGATARSWTDLLRPAKRKGLESPDNPGPEVLDGGVQVLAEMERVWGLHLLRRGRRPGRSGGDNLPVSLEASGRKVETEVRTTRLSLRRNRPLVSLGYLSAGLKELTQVEESWGPAYLGAGCSAFVGPLWAVAPEVEAAFLSGFYTGLWRGATLGAAFAAGRRLAQSVAPDSMDWLAYLLLGDPLARPYRPVASEGYATVEPVGRQVDDPLSPGSEARFRVKLRRTPPVWYEDRVVEVAKELVFDKLEVHVIAPGLELRPTSPIDMFHTSEGDYQGWFTLAVPGSLPDESAHVQVYFVDGERMVHGVMFSQPIRRGK